jgi:hypothetical protein
MKFIHTVTIEQTPDGRTWVTQASRKEGSGPVSPQMQATLTDYNAAFTGFFGKHRPTAETITTAEWGKALMIEGPDEKDYIWD